MPQPDYKLSDLKNRPFDGQFYIYELFEYTVSPQTEFETDKVVGIRNDTYIKQHPVKWRGYDESSSLG